MKSIPEAASSWKDAGVSPLATLTLECLLYTTVRGKYFSVSSMEELFHTKLRICLLLYMKLVVYQDCALSPYTGWSKKRGHYVWLLISSKRMNQFVWVLADFNVILLWTHLLTIMNKFVTQVAPPSDKIKNSVFHLQNHARPLYLVHFFKILEPIFPNFGTIQQHGILNMS